MEIIGNHGAIAVQTQQREGRCARRTKGRRGRQRLGKQGDGPSAPRRVCVLACAFAERPQCSPVAVFGALVFKPGPVEAHEVAKALGVGIPGVLHEGGKAGRQDFGQTFFAGIVEGTGQQQGAGVVIDAIAVRAIGHRMHGVLEQAGVVAHRQKMAELHVRHVRGRGDQRRDRCQLGAGDHLQPVTLPRMLERSQIALGGALPGHRPAGGVGAFAHRQPARVVGEQLRNFVADRRRVAERNQNAAPIGQQLAGVPIRRRDHRLAEAEAVGQRPRRHLRFVEIGRDVHVAHRDEFEQGGLIDELVEEYDVVVDPKFAHACHQALAIGLTLVPNQIGMRRTEHDIDRVGAAFQDRGHGVDHDLDALGGGQQAECQNDRAAVKSEFGLGRVGLDKRKVGNAMGDDLDLVVRHAIDAAQQLASLVGHHDDLRGRFDDAFHHRALRRGRLGQHGVQRRDNRHRQARQQLEDVGAGVAAENSELVLQTDDVEPAGIQEGRGAHIFFDAVIPDLQGDRSGIIIGLTVVGHRHDRGLKIRPRGRYRAFQVGREGCDSAAAWQRIADHRDPAQRRHVRAWARPVDWGTAGADGMKRLVDGSPSLCNKELTGRLAGYAIRAFNPLLPTSMLVRPPPMKIA